MVPENELLDELKKEIQKYVIENQLEFVTDQTNFDDDYTRNYIRLNILPQIEKIFPEFEKSIARFSLIAKTENDYMNEQAQNAVCIKDGVVEIGLPLHPALLARASVIAMKEVGIKKDWEKSHVDGIIDLSRAANGTKINLKNNLIAIKEYDFIAIYKNAEKNDGQIPFTLGSVQFNDLTLTIKKREDTVWLKDGFFIDADKIPPNAIIRTKRDGDKFTKFGGGTKKLTDYLTDKKVPLRLRDNLAVIADGNEILAIFNLAVSNKVKVDDNTKTILELIQEN